MRVSLAFIGFALLFAAVIGLFLFLFPSLGGFYDAVSDEIVPSKMRPNIILDAGHGGIDGGAVSGNGTPEKDLNLQITRILADLLRENGYTVILTRTEDVMLTSDAGGSRKMQDLRGRLEIASSHPDALFLSIHMNTYPSSSCTGLQVYYTRNNSEAEAFAESVQSTVKKMLQPDNDRAIKPATSSIYLLDRNPSCAILVECGFLSNSTEAEALADPDYQHALALAIGAAVVSFTQEASWQRLSPRPIGMTAEPPK